MSSWDPASLELIALLSRTARGPKREGIYALWLTLRVAQDLQLDPPIPERLHRRRLAALEARLSSLTLPPPLRRALTSTLHHLKEPSAGIVPQLLASLVAPTRDSTSPEAAESVAKAARAARLALR